MKKYLIIFFIAFAALASAENALSDYTYLKSAGEMPQQVKDILSSNNEENFYLKTLFETGRLVYGSELNIYIEKIADELLKNDKGLRKKLSFYILKSSEVNAMVTDEGIVIVNIGLLAQARNESELAFIIGHEIIHFTDHKKTKQKIKSMKDFLAYNHGSRMHESEADMFALQRYFIPSAYSTEAIKGVFDVMRYGYLPFDEVAFPKTEVEESFYQFPENYYLSAIKPIRSRDDYVDTLSTHSNIKKRESALLSKIENGNNGNEFLQGKELFIKIRDIARFEYVNFDLTIHRYDRAIYNIFILKKEFPQNKFLDVALGAAYYGFHKHKVNNESDGIIGDYKEVEGEMQQVSYFLDKINKKEANVLAIRQLLYMVKKYSDNSYLKNLAIDAMVDLQQENNMKIEQFSDFAKDEVIDTAKYVEVVKINAGGDKYSKIKNATMQYVFPNEKFKTVNYMLVDLHRDSIFTSFYEAAIRKTEDEEVLNVAKLEGGKIEQGGKILIVPPSYRKNSRDGKTASYSQSGEKTLTRNIKSCVKSLKLNYQMQSEAKPENTESFNDMALLGQWYLEYHSDKFSMINYQTQWFAPLMKEKGIRYVNFVSIVSQNSWFWVNHKTEQLLTIPFNILTAPFKILRIALPNKSQKLYFSLYDVENLSTLLTTSYEAENTNPEAFINQQLYNMYYYVKTGKK
jgi:hypothetical protein